MKKSKFASIKLRVTIFIMAFVVILPVLQAQNADKGKLIFDGTVADAFRGPNLSFLNGVYSFPLIGPSRRPGLRFKIDTDKTYRLSGEFRVVGVESPVGTLFLGFDPFDQQGRVIRPINVLAAKNTPIATLASMAMNGDTTLVINDAKKWEKIYPVNLIAFGAEEDNSDTPNFNLSPCIRKDGARRLPDGNLELTLVAPLKLSYPAGTRIRLHSDGPSNIYTGGWKKLSTQWQNLSGTISGTHSSDTFGPKHWYKSTAAAQVVMFLDAPAQDGGKLELRNIKVEETDSEK